MILKAMLHCKALKHLNKRNLLYLPVPSTPLTALSRNSEALTLRTEDRQADMRSALPLRRAGRFFITKWLTAEGQHFTFRKVHFYALLAVNKQLFLLT